MAGLKRHMIELVKNPEEVMKGGEPEIERHWTPAFIPYGKVRQAMQMQLSMEDEEKSELETMELLTEFVAVEIYNNAFTVDDLYNRLHAPDALDVLQSQLLFVAQGDQTDATKKFLEKKR
ncbi:phage tail assembly chaperone G [Rossellomorea marisflavi]|uniref:phage tail assembly chaperone G n=1 Tax=Rossellomorea marisflavi TaxID=189381 RepID=UPI0034579411